MDRSILLVEDDKDIRELLRTLFQLQGYNVNIAGNGQEALDFLLRDEHPSVILLDLMMPVMSGQQFCEIRKASPDLLKIPVVILSADTTAAQKAPSLGANAGLTKPVDFGDLVKLIDKICDDQGDSDDTPAKHQGV